MQEEKYIFTDKLKKSFMITIGVGLVLAIVGILAISFGGHGDEGGEGHGAFHWSQRLFTNLWINNVFFTGLAAIGILFFAIQYAAQAGWSASIKRIPFAFGAWLPFAAISMLVVYFLANHHLFHWTHTDLYHVGTDHFDPIINGKKTFFFWPLQEHPSIPVFFLARMVLFFAVWYWLYLHMKKIMQTEDLSDDTKSWYKMRSTSAIFIIIFAVTSSIAAWDWIMSIDTHWFSTMFGWYAFASWWVTGLALVTLIVVLLKEAGYLSIVNSNHIHDLGKFVFAFSIFWTYIWFSQFLLIYYANIPEESIYFVERMYNDKYAPFFFLVLILNFVLPFLLLMTRDSKRHSRFMKLVLPIVIVGHWLDFYMMITPGTLKENGGFGFLEIGLILVYGGAFLFVFFNQLSKAPLYSKNHPMLQESLHHHI